MAKGVDMAPHLRPEYEPIGVLAARAGVSKDTARTALDKLEEIGQATGRNLRKQWEFKSNENTPKGLF